MLRLIRRLFVVTLLLGTAAVVALGAFSRSEPDWYQPAPRQDEEVAQLADRVEYRLLEEAQRIRPVEELWTLRVRDEQVNAWLATRLQDWIAHEQSVRWPESIGTPQVRFEPEHVELALPFGDGAYRRVVVARLVPDIREGALWMNLAGIQVGRLSMPGDPLATLMTMLRRAALDGYIDGSEWEPVVDLLSGRRPVDPVLTLSDDRRVELVAVRCRPGAIELTSRTRDARPAAPPAEAPAEAPIDPRWEQQAAPAAQGG